MELSLAMHFNHSTILINAVYKIVFGIIIILQMYMTKHPYNMYFSNNGVIYFISIQFIINSKYVQDILRAKKEKVAQFLCGAGVFMLCGSMKIQHSVLNTLDQITQELLDLPLSDFQLKDQVLKDCY